VLPADAAAGLFETHPHTHTIRRRRNDNVFRTSRSGRRSSCEKLGVRKWRFDAWIDGGRTT
jgi:hypothetical protein